jgi:hypothetical protein
MLKKFISALYQSNINQSSLNVINYNQLLTYNKKKSLQCKLFIGKINTILNVIKVYRIVAEVGCA